MTYCAPNGGDYGKLKELALYILNKTGPLAERELHLLMYRAEMRVWATTGRFLAGCGWQKTADGVCPVV